MPTRVRLILKGYVLNDPNKKHSDPVATDAVTDAANSHQIEHTEKTGMTYDQFLAERNRFIDARQRGQQRVDQLVTGGAAGALVLSITFLEKLASQPHGWTKPILFGGWIALLLSLGGSLVGHYVSQAAFNDCIRGLDECYSKGSEYRVARRNERLTWALEICSSIGFILGVCLLAAFAAVNLSFGA